MHHKNTIVFHNYDKVFIKGFNITYFFIYILYIQKYREDKMGDKYFDFQSFLPNLSILTNAYVIFIKLYANQNTGATANCRNT